MKFVLILLASLLSLSALADTYTGVVSDVKHFHNGGIAVDLDGHYPDEKFANLAQDAEFAFAWPGGRLGLGMVYFHPLLVEPFRSRTKHFLLQSVGWLFVNF